MDLQDALAFVGSHDRTIISTRRSDGRPQMSPVNAGLVDGAVCISSRAPIVDQPAALDLRETVYRAIAGEHPDWDEYRRAMIRDERVVIRIHPQRASGQVY